MQTHLNINHGLEDGDVPPIPYVEFVVPRGSIADDPIDASGIIYASDPEVVYGQVRFVDGADREVVIAVLREVADFFEQNHFPERA